MKKEYSIFRSRKFWAAAVAIVYCVISQFWPDWPVPEETIVGIVATVVSYILGVALEDGLSKQAGVDFREIGKEKERHGLLA